MRPSEQIITLLGGAPVYTAAANTLFAAMTTPPTAARKATINNLIVALQNAGIWASLDILYVMAAADSQAARLNWKNPSTFTLAPANSPSFAADRGYTGDGASSRLAPSWSGGTNGVNFVQNSASAWFWSRTSGQSASPDIGIISTTGNSIVARSVADNVIARVNDNDTTGQPNTDGSGFLGVQRSGSSAKRYWRNGAQVGIDISVASVAPSTSGVWVCGANPSSFSTRQEAAAAWGASLSGLESSFYSAMLTYMQAVGAA